MEGTILHADADSFFAAVEQRDDPRLRGRPTIVGPGVVMAASYEAKAYGIHGGMGAGKARRLCPDAVFVAPRFEAYSEAGHALFEVFRDTSPVVEGLSIEEAFLDVRGLEHISGSPGDIARRLRRRVRAEVGLPVSVGVARTKILAKMASRQAKPDGLLVVELERELEFLHPIPVAKLWGVGASTAAKLHGRGIMTVGQMALVPQEALMAILGRASAATCTRSPRTATRGAYVPAAGGARSAPSARSAAGPAPKPSSTPRSWRSSTASRGGCARRTGSAAPSCCVCASATTRGRANRARCGARPRRPTSCSPRRAGC